MKKENTSLWLIRLLCLLCALAALVLALRRVKLEQAQKSVYPMMSWQDLSDLAKKSRQPVEDWCDVLAKAGLQSVLLTPQELEDPEILGALSESGLSHGQIGGLSQGGLYCFALCYDESMTRAKLSGPAWTVEKLPFSQVLQSLKDTDSLLVLVEKESQTGILLPEGWTDGAYPGPIAKGYWLNRWCSASVGRLGYPGMEETENILYRAVVDRGIQVLWLMPIYTESWTLLTDPADYAALLSSLRDRLEPAGYSYGLPQGYPDSEPSLWLLLAAGMGVLLACLLLLNRLRPLSGKLLWILAAVCALENLAGLLLFRHTQITLLALAASVCFPCLAVVLLWLRLKRAGEGTRLLPGLFLGAAVCVGISLLGGLFVAALQSGRDYLLVLRLFRGVKLSQAAVYGFSILYFAWMYLHRPGLDWKREWRGLLNRRVILTAAGLLLLALGVGAVYLLRTGDHMISVSEAELRARNWLEHCLFYRPRTKEFLLAWPALGLAFYFAHRGKRGLSALMGSMAGIGFASLVNTFCHSRSHLLVDLARAGIGLAIGFALSLLLMGLLSLLWRNKKSGASA